MIPMEGEFITDGLNMSWSSILGGVGAVVELTKVPKVTNTISFSASKISQLKGKIVIEIIHNSNHRVLKHSSAFWAFMPGQVDLALSSCSRSGPLVLGWSGSLQSLYCP